MDGTLALPPPGCETFGKFLCLSFHICEVGVLRALLHQGCWEEYVMLAKDERSSRLAVINPHWGPITDLHSLSPQDPIPRGDQGPAVLIARTNTYTGNSEASECLHPPLHPPRLHPPRLGSLLDRPFPLKQQIQSRSTHPREASAHIRHRACLQNKLGTTPQVSVSRRLTEFGTFTRREATAMTKGRQLTCDNVSAERKSQTGEHNLRSQKLRLAPRHGWGGGSRETAGFQVVLRNGLRECPHR